MRGGRSPGHVHAAEPAQAHVIAFRVEHDRALPQPDQPLSNQPGDIRLASLRGAVRQASLPAGGPRTAGGLSPLAAGPAALPAALPRRDRDLMKGWFAHRDFAHRDFAHRDAADLGKLDDLLPSLPHVVADRACCCPARPVVTVIMPAAPGRPNPVDLLLCGHHFRVSQAALTAAGAAVYDDTGALVAGGVSEDRHDLREHAAAA
jgi:hypothetical protein